jgi:hypothetical protein
MRTGLVGHFAGVCAIPCPAKPATHAATAAARANLLMPFIISSCPAASATTS